MFWHKIPFLLFCLLTLAIIHLTHSQNTPEDYVNAHNSARSAVGIGSIVWDTTVATYAQNYANLHINDCNLVHSGGPYGENLAKGSSGFFTDTAAVNLWVSEKPYYDYASNSCVGGQCLHYTQVVWNTLIHLGCARVQCTDGWYWVICNYNSPGNYVGRRPY